MIEKILVVDDEKDTRDFMARALSDRYEVTTAADAALAMQQLEADKSIRLLLSDVRMPGEDGITLMKAAKAANPNLAVVLLTAFGSIDQAVAAMKDGADDFLTKPVDLDQLELRVKKALKAHRLEEEVEDLRAQLDELNRQMEVLQYKKHYYEGLLAGKTKDKCNPVNLQEPDVSPEPVR